MPAKKKATVTKLGPLIAEVRSLIQSARHAAASSVNTLQLLTNFEIGRRIVAYEQKGEKRAEYGELLMRTLAARLTEEFGRGFSKRNLDYMRRFYLDYADRSPRIVQKPSAQFVVDGIFRKPAGKLITAEEIAQKPSAQLAISEKPSRKSPFTLSWSHYVLLLTIKDTDERSFYEIEATSEGWSLPELKRQKASCLYERLALSRDKKGVKRLAEKGQIIARSEDVLKEPYILEFLGLDEKAGYSESNLETAIIDRIEHFLLELGKGFLFEARQKRFTFDEDHFFVDLVFYNRLLHCYVLIDLKLDKLTHQDLGQMQMYVNYFDRHVKLPKENPTIGILLCKEKKAAVVKLTVYDLAAMWRDASRCVVSGFHSPVEKECLNILLRGKQPIILCPGRSLTGMRLPCAWQKEIETGRMLILSPFLDAPRRITADSAARRNEFVAALADEVFIAHITPGGKTETLYNRITAWGIPFV